MKINKVFASVIMVICQVLFFVALSLAAPTEVRQEVISPQVQIAAINQSPEQELKELLAAKETEIAAMNGRQSIDFLKKMYTIVVTHPDLKILYKDQMTKQRDVIFSYAEKNKWATTEQISSLRIMWDNAIEKPKEQ